MIDKDYLEQVKELYKLSNTLKNVEMSLRERKGLSPDLFCAAEFIITARLKIHSFVDSERKRLGDLVVKKRRGSGVLIGNARFESKPCGEL